MMRDRKALQASRWMWAAGVFVTLALVGCTPRQAQNNTPTERVAGARQEDGDLQQALQQSGLPETLAFGGRTWKAHEVHRVKPDTDDTGTGDSAATSGTGTTASPAGASTPSGTAAGDTTAGRDAEDRMGGFKPMPGLTVQEHQIFYRTDADEAVTDNLYLQASSAAGATTESTGAAGAPTGTSGAAGTEMVFIEYEATGDMLSDSDIKEVLQTTNAPPSITAGGKTLKADEVQVYDVDVFKKLQLAPAPMSGHTALQDPDDKNTVYLMAEMPTGSTGSTSTGSTGTEAATPPSGTESGATMAGPIFIKYDADGPDGGPGATEAGTPVTPP
jgi:hypothetical protein